MTPSSCRLRSRALSTLRGSPGAPSRISPNRVQPNDMLRKMIGVHRSANTSAARVTGQYWP